MFVLCFFLLMYKTKKQNTQWKIKKQQFFISTFFSFFFILFFIAKVCKSIRSLLQSFNPKIILLRRRQTFSLARSALSSALTLMALRLKKTMQKTGKTKKSLIHTYQAVMRRSNYGNKKKIIYIIHHDDKIMFIHSYGVKH